VDDRIAAIDESVCTLRITQVSLKPLQIADFVETFSVAGRPMPTTELMSLLSQLIGDVATNKSRRSRYSNPHCVPFFYPG
jgi:hypothetical protein